jgi:hypothetical protein
MVEVAAWHYQNCVLLLVGLHEDVAEDGARAHRDLNKVMHSRHHDLYRI